MPFLRSFLMVGVLVVGGVPRVVDPNKENSMATEVVTLRLPRGMVNQLRAWPAGSAWPATRTSAGQTSSGKPFNSVWNETRRLEMKRFLFCIGGSKPEAYARHGRPEEWLLRGMVYLWQGVEVPDPDDPEETLLLVCRPRLGKPFLAPRSEFIPLEELPEFFAEDEVVLAGV
jgi:hypothetical protein